MTTILDVGTLALRKLGVLGRGNAPTAEDGRDILSAAQSFYDELVSAAKLTPVVATANASAEENTRVLAGSYTITFPTTIADGETRTPYDLSIVSVVTAGQDPDTRIYDATRGEWVSLVSLTLTGDAPLANRGKDALACCWAKKLAEIEAVDVSAEIQLGAARFLHAFRSARNRTEGPDYY